MSRALRLVAFDLDGTLLGPGLAISEAVAEAVRLLREAGVTVAVVTGRMARTAERFALELGLDGMPLVGFNGALAKLVGRSRLWWHVTIPTELAIEVVSFLDAKGLGPVVLARDRILARGPDERIDRYQTVAGVRPEYVGDLAGRLRGPKPIRPTKLLQVEDPAAMDRLLAEAAQRFGARLSVTTSYPFFLEFMAPGVSKGRALARVCRRLGIRADEVAAFGDGMNDLDMIEWAGLGVAMAESPAALLAAADRVVEGPPGDGVARFIRERLIPLRR